MERKPCEFDCDSIRCIQTEEPYARLSVRGDICAHIQFRKCREPRDCRRSTQTDIRHNKRHDADPGLLIKMIEFELCGNKSAQCLRGNRPMREQQVAPVLRDDPRLPGLRPWPMCQ